MSNYDQKDNDLVLFKNDKKETDNHPDYKGSGRVNGVDVWLSAWVNKSKSGQTYMSLKTQNKEQVHQQGVEQVRQAAAPVADFDEEDLPF